MGEWLIGGVLVLIIAVFFLPAIITNLSKNLRENYRNWE
jgi:hypothetical protein